MYYYIYKITCLCGELKDHYYIGKRNYKFKHPENDLYTGSGNIIRNYFKKYPKIEGETYLKEILEFNNSTEENAQREIEIIGDLWKTDPLCLNLCGGGQCAVSMKGRHHTEDAKKKMSIGHKGICPATCWKKGNEPWNKGKHNIYSEETLFKMSEVKKGKKAWNKGVPMTEERKKINSLSHKGIPAWNRHPVIQMTLEGEIIKEWETIQKAIIETGAKNISAVCRGLRKQAGGFIWKYA